jgi:CheY-like chemotaxis protein
MKIVLVIEDNPYDARLITQILKSSYFVLHAEDAEQGLLLAAEQKPDLILLDMGLPDLDGQTVAALIRSTPELEDVPLVAVTAWPPDTARDMTEAYGFTAYISKPIDVQDFRARIAVFLGEGI